MQLYEAFSEFALAKYLRFVIFSSVAISQDNQIMMITSSHEA